MAKDDELELDTRVTAKSGKTKLIVIIAVVILLTTSSLIAVLYFTGNIQGLAGDNGTDDADNPVKEDKVKSMKKAFYFNMQPAFIVNFEEQSKAAYLQIEMQAMTYEKKVIDIMTKHMPVIRNNILLIMSAQKFAQVKTRTGKEKLQAEILKAVQEVIVDATKARYKADKKKIKNDESIPNVEQIYFTSFIMQ